MSAQIPLDTGSVPGDLQKQAQTEWNALKKQLIVDQVDVQSIEFKDLEARIPAWPALDRLKFLKQAMEIRAFALIRYLVGKQALDINVKAERLIKTMQYASCSAPILVGTEVEKRKWVIAMDFETQPSSVLDLQKIAFLLEQGSALSCDDSGVPNFGWNIAPLALETLATSVCNTNCQQTADSKCDSTASQEAKKADPALQAACTWLILFAWKNNYSIFVNADKNLKHIFSNGEQNNPNIKRLEIAWIAKKLQAYFPYSQVFEKPLHRLAVTRALSRLSTLLLERDMSVTTSGIMALHTIKAGLFTLAKRDLRLATILGGLHRKYAIQFAPEAEKTAEATYYPKQVSCPLM